MFSSGLLFDELMRNDSDIPAEPSWIGRGPYSFTYCSPTRFWFSPLSLFLLRLFTRRHVATRIILLFFASLRENLFVFLFPLFCYYLSLLASRNTPVDYVTTPSTYSFIYCACISFGSSFT